MGLSRLIEYLLSLPDPSGRGQLLYAGASQTIIPNFPPGLTITLESRPAGYMYIPFKVALGPAMVPNAFSAWAQQYGAKSQEGTLGGWLINNALEAYVPVTQAEPSLAQITNQSPLVQYYEGIVFFLEIPEEDNYKEVLDVLRRLGTSAKLEEMAEEAQRLLEKLTTPTRLPQPSLVRSG